MGGAVDSTLHGRDSGAWLEMLVVPLQQASARDASCAENLPSSGALGVVSHSVLINPEGLLVTARFSFQSDIGPHLAQCTVVLSARLDGQVFRSQASRPLRQEVFVHRP